MANVNQVADPVALPLVPCPDCGKQVVTFVARRGQFEGERFYKCRNHNPGRGGCDFYRWQEAYAGHLAGLGPAAPPLAQVNPGENEVVPAIEGGQMQPADGAAGQQNRAPDGSQLPSAASGVAGSHIRAGDVGRRQISFTLNAASINLVVSLGNMDICICILVLLVCSTMMRAFD
ncbi:uncharacterized protein LOC119279450 [Triticum dicoccoides]|uniref:uncharacterized protein LOC119279450 n=1 Tax=Triticum dicoccoides TaxID=85692 RepID=UPI00162D3552|nr:uncharacterized protein LOC119279450 [Triticum dicoccoides]